MAAKRTLPVRDEVTTLIAEAIKDADRTYFFENYTNQATAVLAELEERGLCIVPMSPPEDAIEAGREVMRDGRYRPSEVLTAIYKAMVDSCAA